MFIDFEGFRVHLVSARGWRPYTALSHPAAAAAAGTACQPACSSFTDSSGAVLIAFVTPGTLEQMSRDVDRVCELPSASQWQTILSRETVDVEAGSRAFRVVSLLPGPSRTQVQYYFAHSPDRLLAFVFTPAPGDSVAADQFDPVFRHMEVEEEPYAGTDELK